MKTSQVYGKLRWQLACSVPLFWRGSTVLLSESAV